MIESVHVVDERGQKNVELSPDHTHTSDDAALECVLDEAEDVLNSAADVG